MEPPGMSDDRGKASGLGGGRGYQSPHRKRLDGTVDNPLKRSLASMSGDAGLINEKEKDCVLAQPTLTATGRRTEHRHITPSSFAKSNASEDSVNDNREPYVGGLGSFDEVRSTWISSFCNQRGNEYFCEVPYEFIKHNPNLYGLRSKVPYYDYALDILLNGHSSHGDTFTEEQREEAENDVEWLYGLVHARYIVTNEGLRSMLLLHVLNRFGTCPRVLCSNHPCFPVGQSDIPASGDVKIYCPKCEEIYHPKLVSPRLIDGEYFGTTFPHLFLMKYGFVKPKTPSEAYVPRVFGLKINEPPDA